MNKPELRNRRRTTRILANQQISETAWELSFERNGLEFIAGECISLTGKDELDVRDYTIASGEQDDAIRVVYRMIEYGALTPQLVTWKAGDSVDYLGPYGTFTLRDPAAGILFIATGTGIAPARSFLRSHPELKMSLMHGARETQDLFYREEWSKLAYTPCVTQPDSSDQGLFRGRVTDRLREIEVPADTHVYLCGANEMIYEVQEILKERDFDLNQVFHEPYYYRDEV